MKTCFLPGTATSISRIAYGCANLAPWDGSPIDGDAIARADRLIKIAIDQGIVLFDHADLYGFGKAEQVFGEVLQRSPGLREKVVIQSKCGQFFRKDWNAGDAIGIDTTREHILAAVEGSLKRLRIEQLDILLLHLPDPLMEPQEIAAAFDHLKRAGQVHHFGVSNFRASQIARLQKVLAEPLIVNQIQVGLGVVGPIAEGYEFALSLSRGPDAGKPPRLETTGHVLDYCQLHGIQVQAWSPLRGELLKPTEEVASGVKPIVLLLTKLAREKGVTPAAIGLAWLLKHPACIVPVVGTTHPQHLIENCVADQVQLTREEWYRLFAAAAGCS